MTKSKQEWIWIDNILSTTKMQADLQAVAIENEVRQLLDKAIKEERQRVVEMIEDLRKTKRFHSTDTDFSALAMQSGYLFALSDLKSKLEEK